MSAPTYKAVRLAMIQAMRIPANMLGKITPETTPHDIGMDELDLTEVIMDFEDETDFDIPGAALEEMTLMSTLEEIAAMIDTVRPQEDLDE